MILHPTPLFRLALALLFSAWAPLPLVFAQDLSGTWHGELVRGMNERFVIDMELMADAGRITGTSHITFPWQQAHYARMAIEGESRGGMCRLRESGIVEQSLTEYRWVLQGGALRLDTNGTAWRLYGEWHPPGCAPGRIMLLRTAMKQRAVPEPPPPVLPRRMEGRPVDWEASVTLAADSTLLLLYDDRRMDGDTVTIFVNGDCIARRIAVPHRFAPRAIPIRLRPGTNYLVMQAENEGSEPPNTAGLVLQAAGVEHRLVLRATVKRSGGLRIQCGP